MEAHGVRLAAGGMDFLPGGWGAKREGWSNARRGRPCRGGDGDGRMVTSRTSVQINGDIKNNGRQTSHYQRRVTNSERKLE